MRKVSAKTQERRRKAFEAAIDLKRQEGRGPPSVLRDAVADMLRAEVTAAQKDGWPVFWSYYIADRAIAIVHASAGDHS